MVDILMVEDNKELSSLMSRFLVKEGYTVYSAHSAAKAKEFMANDTMKLVLLDIMLPDEDGYYVCQKIREKDNVPIIFISALVDKEAKIKSFMLGADDYVEKPVDIDILSAKIAAMFKRNYNIGTDKSRIESGAIVLDQDKMQVEFKNIPLSLTTKEYDLLQLFVENTGKTLSKEYLFGQIWGADSNSENQTLTVHIKMLRDKIEDNPKEPKRIVTVWGTGYRYEKI